MSENNERNFDLGVAEIAQPYILARYPQLNGVGKDVIINSQADVETFLNSQKKL